MDSSKKAPLNLGEALWMLQLPLQLRRDYPQELVAGFVVKLQERYWVPKAALRPCCHRSALCDLDQPIQRIVVVSTIQKASNSPAHPLVCLQF